jgi:pimeloyl-ACP methyl ester carboxylesterase
MSKIELGELEFHYQLEGEADRTIVLVNGLADTLETWELQVPDLLAAGYRVLRFDNRGVGATSKPVGPYTTQMMAQDAHDLVSALGLESFHLIGVSMGGMIAQEYALAFPEQLLSVTFACTYAAPGPFCSRMFSMWADLAPVLGVPFVMRDVTLWAFTNAFFEERERDLREFEEAMAFGDQPMHAYLAQLKAIQTHDTRSRLRDLQLPAMVLAGDQDILIPTYLSKELAKLTPGSAYRETKGGHGCVWEYPDEFNQTFLSFINSVGG